MAKSCGLGPIFVGDFGPDHVPDIGEQSSENEKGSFRINCQKKGCTKTYLSFHQNYDLGHKNGHIHEIAISIHFWPIGGPNCSFNLLSVTKNQQENGALLVSRYGSAKMFPISHNYYFFYKQYMPQNGKFGQIFAQQRILGLQRF